jgi:hypothetical protein
MGELIFLPDFEVEGLPYGGPVIRNRRVPNAPIRVCFGCTEHVDVPAPPKLEFWFNLMSYIDCQYIERIQCTGTT